MVWSFSSLQSSSFIKPVLTVASGSCPWLTGVGLMWSFAVVTYLPQDSMCCLFWDAFQLSVLVKSYAYIWVLVVFLSAWTIHSVYPFTSSLSHQQDVSAHRAATHRMFLAPFCVNSRDFPAWKSQINSFWNTQTSPSDTNNLLAEITYHLHSDVWFEHWLRLLTCICVI